MSGVNKQSWTELKNENGETVEYLEETAILLNEYFSSMFTKERFFKWEVDP